MAKANRTCKICGRKYHYCPSCSGELRPSWYGMFHDENCKNIFYILTDVFLAKTTKAAARKRLSKCDLSEMASFNTDVKKQLDDILHTRKPSGFSLESPRETPPEYSTEVETSDETQPL